MQRVLLPGVFIKRKHRDWAIGFVARNYPEGKLTGERGRIAKNGRAQNSRRMVGHGLFLRK